LSAGGGEGLGMPRGLARSRVGQMKKGCSQKRRHKV